MSAIEVIILASGGFVAGILNTLSGGGSLLTVPMLVALGLPAGVANGTNRIGVLLQNATATWGFYRRGVPGFAQARPLLVPVVLGAIVGAFAVTQLPDLLFQRLFGVAMIALLPSTLRSSRAQQQQGRQPLGSATTQAVFFLIGIYGGAIQAGVGILLVAALSRLGYDLVLASSIKVIIALVFTVAALPIFILQGQIAWLPSLVLGFGFAAGGELGAHLAVRKGEALLRPVLALSIALLAGRMLGFY